MKGYKFSREPLFKPGHWSAPSYCETYIYIPEVKCLIYNEDSGGAWSKDSIGIVNEELCVGKKFWDQTIQYVEDVWNGNVEQNQEKEIVNETALQKIGEWNNQPLTPNTMRSDASFNYTKSIQPKAYTKVFFDDQGYGDHYYGYEEIKLNLNLYEVVSLLEKVKLRKQLEKETNEALNTNFEKYFKS